MDSHELRIVGLVEIQKFVANEKNRNEIFLWGQLLTPTPNTFPPLYSGKGLNLRY